MFLLLRPLSVIGFALRTRVNRRFEARLQRGNENARQNGKINFDLGGPLEFPPFIS